MSAESAHGIILRVRPLGDTSVIVHWLTAESGRIATVAKGARGSKSAFAGKLDLCYEADFSFRRSRKSELHALGELVVTGTHAAMKRDLETLEILAHAVSSIEQATEVDTPQPEVYELFCDLLAFLENHGAMPRAVFAWDLRFLSLQGLEPDLDSKNLGAGARDLMSELLTCDWDDLARLTPDNEAVARTRRFIEAFWIHQYGRLPGKGKSDKVPVLREKRSVSPSTTPEKPAFPAKPPAEGEIPS